MDVYATLVKTNGYLLLSGFYEHDVLDVAEKAFQYGFVEKELKTKDDWAALILEKL
jgi:ribosomal protein L11 methyltransferase